MERSWKCRENFLFYPLLSKEKTIKGMAGSLDLLQMLNVDNFYDFCYNIVVNNIKLQIF
jgi:hypothetical protein